MHARRRAGSVAGVEAAGERGARAPSPDDHSRPAPNRVSGSFRTWPVQSVRIGPVHQVSEAVHSSYRMQVL